MIDALVSSFEKQIIARVEKQTDFAILSVLLYKVNRVQCTNK